MARAISRESRASSIVIGSFRATVRTTGSRVRIDSPRSPPTASRTHRRYWSGIGSFNPYLARISARPASSDSVPPMTRAGSPGIMRTPVKTIRLMTKSVTTEIAARWTRNSSNSVPARTLEADQPVGDGPVALEVLRERHDVVLVEQVDDV